MSTRSGKRIHSSDIENVEKVVELQTVRKTRSKKQKENNDEVATAKKKKNFVRRPSGDETESLNDKTELASKGSRKSRRNTLKELNVVDNDSEILHDKTSMRHSRRIRKEDAEPTNILVEEDIKSKEKKKSKKKKVIVTENIEIEPEAVIIPKKKSNKKKTKNSNSFIVEDLALPREDISFNRSNISVDSFHSAAGSPDKYTLDNETKNDDTRHKRRERKISSSTTCDNTNENHKGKKKNKKIEKDKTEKLGFKETSFEEVDSKSEPIDAKNEMSSDNKNGETLKTKPKKKKKSKENNCLNDVNTNNTFDNIDVDLKSPLECELPGSLNSSVKASPQTRWNGIAISDVNDIAAASYMPDVNCVKSTPDKSTPSNSSKKRRKSHCKISNSTEINTSTAVLNASYNGNDSILRQSTNKKEMRKSVDKNSTYDNIMLSETDIHNTSERNCDNNIRSIEKKSPKNRRTSQRRSSIQNNTYDKTDDKIINLNATFDKEITENTSNSSTYVGRKSRSSKFSLEKCDTSTVLNGTYDKSVEITSTLNNTFDKPKLDATFECTDDKKHIEPRTTSSIISSDNTNMTSDLSEDCSRISITSDDSRTEHIVNTTPLLIESSMEESRINKTITPLKDEASEVKNTPDKQTTEHSNMTPLKRDGTYTDLRKTPLKRQGTFTEEPKPEAAGVTPVTPLKREGTFTKDSPSRSPKVSDKTPTRRKSMPSPGRTPFPFSKSNSKEKSMLNLTHSIEKPKRRSSVAAAAPRLTRVMFCSPVDNPASTTLVKGKVIKSNLKGSNKSFVFEESVCESPGVARKRSLTHGSEVGEAKRARLTTGSQHRPRTTSATARLQDPGTPKKDVTPSKSKPPRTKLPNFAALHQKHFGKMESLDECQERKARRAKQLLTPNTHTDTTSPKDTSTNNKPEMPEAKTIEKKMYTKFGFKLNPDVNPFSIPSKTIKPKDNIIKQGLRRQATLPSLAGTTLRKEAAKQTVMREKSFTDKRDEARRENRTVIKGVRTNRRFELQMKMRNIN